MRTLSGGRLWAALLFLAGAWLLWGAPSVAADPAEENESSEELQELEPKLSGLAAEMWAFADPQPYLGPIPEAGSVEEAGIYGYYLDVANGFLYAASWDGPCGCGEMIWTAAFKKKNGRHLLLKSGYSNTCGGDIPFALASEPWATIMPKGFSLKTFYRPDESPLTDKAYLYFQVEIPENGRRLTLNLKPALGLTVPFSYEALFQPIHGQYSVEEEHRYIKYSHTALRWALKDMAEKGGFDELFLKKVDYRPEEIRELAAHVAQHPRAATWLKEGETAIAAELTELYAIYAEYNKCALKSLVLEWSRDKNRFEIVEKIPLDSVQPFVQFLLTEYFFSFGC